MKSVHVQYFALLREERGQSVETVLSDAVTAGDLYDSLRSRHGFSLPRNRLKVVVNDEFREWDHPLVDGDSVVFIPPVAGG